MKKIKYDQVLAILEENYIPRKVSELIDEVKGIQLKDTDITREYVDSRSMMHSVFNCPYCGEETEYVDYSEYKTGYREAILFQTPCCKKNMFYTTTGKKSSDGIALLYGTKAVIDGRNCEMFACYKDNHTQPEKMICFDTDNYRKYMWDGENECNRKLYDFIYYYWRNKAVNLSIYLDGCSFKSINRDAVTLENNMIVASKNYLSNIFSNYENELELIKEAEKSKKPASKRRQPSDFASIKEANELIAAGCFRGEDEVYETALKNTEISMEILELDNIGSNHRIGYSCPKCGKNYTANNHENGVSIAIEENNYCRLEAVGIIENKCSCGFDFTGHPGYSSYRSTHWCSYIDEDEENIYATLWLIFQNRLGKLSISPVEMISIRKNDATMRAILTNYQPKDKTCEFIKEYNAENGTDYHSSYRCIDPVYSVLQYCCTAISNTMICCKAPSLKYSNIENSASMFKNFSDVAGYILAYYKNDVLEKVSKIFPDAVMPTVSKILGNSYSNGYFDGDDCSSVHAVFNVSKANLKILLERFKEMGKYDLTTHGIIRLINDNNEIATLEQLRYFSEKSIEYYSLKEIYRDLPGVTTNEIINYLEHCRQYQCIHPANAARLWKDYLFNAKGIGVDLHDKRARRPRSLKLEHDVLAYKMSLIRDELRNTRFAERTKELEKFSYSNSNFSIRPPRNIEELFEEGRKLNHCVGSYGDKIIEERSNIFFIRDNERPEEPYFTIEVINGTITQFYGLDDRPPRIRNDKKVIEFVDNWCKNFGFFYPRNRY